MWIQNVGPIWIRSQIRIQRYLINKKIKKIYLKKNYFSENNLFFNKKIMEPEELFSPLSL